MHRDQIVCTETARGRFRYRRAAFTAAAGMRQLGASLYELGPDASAFPRHYHCANEEAIYVLEGEGVLNIGDAEVRLRAGDFAALPRGSEFAHRIHNDTAEPLRYLCFSTMIEPDVVAYADSNKVGFFAGTAPGGDKSRRRLTAVFRLEDGVDYFDREPDA